MVRVAESTFAVNLLQSLGLKKPKGLICPRCENSLDNHDPEACERKMSRRFFVGMLAGCAAVATVGTKIALATPEHIRQQVEEFTFKPYMTSRKGDYIITSFITTEARSRRQAVEVMQLRAMGYDVILTDSHAALINARPAQNPHSLFAVERW